MLDPQIAHDGVDVPEGQRTRRIGGHDKPPDLLIQSCCVAPTGGLSRSDEPLVALRCRAPCVRQCLGPGEPLRATLLVSPDASGGDGVHDHGPLTVAGLEGEAGRLGLTHGGPIVETNLRQVGRVLSEQASGNDHRGAQDSRHGEPSSAPQRLALCPLPNLNRHASIPYFSNL